VKIHLPANNSISKFAGMNTLSIAEREITLNQCTEALELITARIKQFGGTGDKKMYAPMPISDLKLSARANNALYNEGFETVQDVLNRYPSG
jgi:DNA-directed RNA polymerase alpha subunit